MKPHQVLVTYGRNMTDRQQHDKNDCQLIPHSCSY